MLKNQIHLYSIDTSFFYKNRENKIHKKLTKLFVLKKKLKKRIKKVNDEDIINKIKHCLETTNKSIKFFKKKLSKMLIKNNNIRILNPSHLKKKNVVSVFESTLTRIMEIPINSLTEDLFIVQTYFFEVIEDIITSGFLYNGEKYVCFTASAGQIRTKKTVFIKESQLKKYQQTLMCGLTIESINKQGGVNINKYLAYLALCNSATDKWEDFDISKSIVVEDMETIVESKVDFIDDKTYIIETKEMGISITHTDGCGMILPSASKKSFMVRLPWIKGLLVPFDFNSFIKIHNCCCIIKDIYGLEHDIISEGIEVIFTKSQFKMYKYYESWTQYIENYKKFNCQASKCNEEEEKFNDAKINYQMLQTLSDMTDDELKNIVNKTVYQINNISEKRNVMLKVFGVTKFNKNKTYLQQAIEIYPDILWDISIQENLRAIKKSLVIDALAGKLDINGKYTFIIPDLYAFCEYLFLQNKTPKGLLKDKEVYCSLYPNGSKLDCLRSPHLFREHAIRKNNIDDIKRKWFITNGLYTSIHDVISKVLMFDVDGDKSLVCADNTIVNVAERNMQNIIPLFYNMNKAGTVIINSTTIYNGLKYAYTGGNIGMISNDITKIWNSNDINLDVIKLLCMENNFTIDYAKTLYKPERPKHIKKLISKYTKAKLPHFFIYAKNKDKNVVEKINNSVVNRLKYLIPNPNINFKKAGFEKFDYKKLMFDSKVNIDNDLGKSIIDKYKTLDLQKYLNFNFKDGEEDNNNYTYLYQDIREQMLKLSDNIYFIVDVLVEYLYSCKNAKIKTTIWESFGDILVENLKKNVVDKYIYCEQCGTLVKQMSNRKKYCEDCWKEINKQQTKERVRKHRQCNGLDNS